jgi:16S rRNA (uracil1498-N3)-methyltransferase
MEGEQDVRPYSFFLGDLAGRDPGETVLLDEDESRHLRSVRLDEGETISLTDGRGRMNAARLGKMRGRQREAMLLEALPAPAALPLELAVAVGNRNRMLWLIEKATEFGVPVISLVETSRSKSVADAGRSRGFRTKAERRALAALKQSGGVQLPEVRAPEAISEFARRFALSGTGTGVLLDPAGPALAARLAGKSDPVTVLVGPEGGLTDEEIRDCIGAGFLPAGLGPTVLRFETAALAAVVLVAQRAAWETEEIDE